MLEIECYLTPVIEHLFEST